MQMTPDPIHWLYGGVALMLWLAVLAQSGLHHRRLRRVVGSPAGRPMGDLLIGYASQSGHAQELAQTTARALSSDAQPVRALPLDQIGVDALAAASRALFILSTTGQGDAPDNGTAFARQISRDYPALDHLSYGLLALGDRTYPQFCGFGRMIDGWLGACGARAIFPRIEMDQTQPDMFLRWLAHIRDSFAPSAELPKALAAPLPLASGRASGWQLVQRDLLNPGSPGGGLFRLHLNPLEDLPHWQAGDIATIDIPLPQGGGVTREYSLASVPQDGQVQLIVRQVRDAAGHEGLGSGWLTRRLQQGDSLRMRIRENPGFHSPDGQHPMILIGSGSGVSGLVAHIRQRARMTQAGPVWLLYGERSPTHDAILTAQLQEWQQKRVLHRLDRSFSRASPDDGGARYVHDLIRQQAQDLSQWVAAGAAIYICGRREGMAQDVQHALADILGKTQLEALTRASRIRRDVY